MAGAGSGTLPCRERSDGQIRVRKLAGLAALGLTSLLVAEAGLRSVMGNMAITELFEAAGSCVRLKPGVEVDYTGWFLGIPPVVQDANAMGYRGVEHPRERSDRGRIAVIGDSMVYGQGVGASEAIPAYLGEDLEVESLNFGVPGLSLVDFLRQYEFAAAWAPDTAVFVLIENDLDASICESVERAGSSARGLYIQRLWFIAKAIGGIALDGLTLDDATRERRAGRVASELGAIRERLDQDGTALRIVALGDPVSPSGAGPVDLLADALDALGVRWLDARSWRPDGLEVIPWEFHLTPDGNRTAARRIAAWLRAEESAPTTR